MKEGWINIRLGDICDILNGYAFKSSKYVSNGIRVIRITNVQKGVIVDNMPKFYPQESYDTIKNFMLHEGDLLMSLTGNVGRVGLLPKDLLPAALNQRVACMRIKTNGVIKEYLYFLLNSNYFENLCIKNSTGAAQLNMSTVWLSNVNIPIPPISVQQRIVDLLDAEFAKIDAIKANADKQLRAAKDLFQAALKEMLTPKEGWKEKKLRDISLSVKDGDWIEKKDQSLSGIRLIQTGNIGIGIYKDKSDTAHYISNETFSRLHCEEVFAGDVLISRLPDPVGRACLIPQMENRCITAVDCSIIKLNEETIIPRYFLLYTQTREYFSKISSLCTGSTRLRISRKKLVEVTIPIPSLSEQIAIADKLDEISDKVNDLQSDYNQTLTLCNDLKQALLKSIFE